MAKIITSISLLSYLLLQIYIQGVYSAGTFTIQNKCDYTVWPGILSNAGIAPLDTTGFTLKSGETKEFTVPSNWGGRFWGRSFCSEDSDGKFSCLTGDCGSDKLECAGNGATPPATLAEFTLDGSGGMDFYDVSLVDGYNLPMLVIPQGGSGPNCNNTGCVVDLNDSCPSELRVTSNGGEGVACKSACEQFGDPKYCCSGAYGSPDTCQPSNYSEIFKLACPRAYSYAYDDKTSTFTCAGADYVIQFCPSPSTSKKSSEGGQTQTPSSSTSTNTPTTNTPQGVDSSMIYQGALDNINGASSTTCRSHAFAAGIFAVVVALLLSSRQLV